MDEWGVTDAGYELLQRTGLSERIDKEWDRLRKLLPRSAFVEDWEIEETLKDSPNERRENIERWLKESRGYRPRPRDFFIVSGKVTDAILSREERDNFGQFKVGSLAELDGLLSSYCLVKDPEGTLSSEYNWRSEGFKTKIYGRADGDLQIDQVQTKPKNGSVLFRRLPLNHINADYSYWPVIIGTALKYAETVEEKIPEADNWQEFMKSLGWSGEIEKPPGWSVSYDNFVSDYSQRIIAQLPDKTNVRKVQKMFFGEMRPNANQEILYLPAIDLEQRLVFFSNIGSGEPVELAPLGEPVKYFPRVYIQKSDASHLFKGGVQGIMKKQSRTTPTTLAYMLWEYDQMREGKTEDEIRVESHKFDE